MKKSYFDSFDRKNSYNFKTICYLQFMQGVFMIILGSLLPYIREAYGISYSQSGFLVSCQTAGNLIGAVIASVLPLFLGTKHSILLLNGGLFVAFALMLLYGNPIYLIVLFLIMGIGRGAVMNYNNGETNKLPGESSVNLNFMHAFFAIGALISPLLVWAFTGTMGGESGWRIAGVCVVVLGGVSVFMTTKTSFSDDTAAQRTKEKKEAGDYRFFKSRLFWFSTLIVMMYMATEASVMGWLTTFFLDSGVVGESYVQLLTSMLWAAFLIGRIACVGLSKRFRSEKLVTYLTICTLAFLILMVLSHNPVGMILGAFGTGLGMSGVYATGFAGISEICKKFTFAVSAFMVITSIGSIVVPSVIGKVAEAVDTRTSMAILIGITGVQLVVTVLNVVYRRKIGGKEMDV